jgi:hypothetical protein
LKRNQFLLNGKQWPRLARQSGNFMEGVGTGETDPAVAIPDRLVKAGTCRPGIRYGMGRPKKITLKLFQRREFRLYLNRVERLLERL